MSPRGSYIILAMVFLAISPVFAEATTASCTTNPPQIGSWGIATGVTIDCRTVGNGNVVAVNPTVLDKYIVLNNGNLNIGMNGSTIYFKLDYFGNDDKEIRVEQGASLTFTNAIIDMRRKVPSLGTFAGPVNSLVNPAVNPVRIKSYGKFVVINSDMDPYVTPYLGKTEFLGETVLQDVRIPKLDMKLAGNVLVERILFTSNHDIALGAYGIPSDITVRNVDTINAVFAPLISIHGDSNVKLINNNISGIVSTSDPDTVNPSAINLADTTIMGIELKKGSNDFTFTRSSLINYIQIGSAGEGLSANNIKIRGSIFFDLNRVSPDYNIAWEGGSVTRHYPLKFVGLDGSLVQNQEVQVFNKSNGNLLYRINTDSNGNAELVHTFSKPFTLNNYEMPHDQLQFKINGISAKRVNGMNQDFVDFITSTYNPITREEYAPVSF